MVVKGLAGQALPVYGDGAQVRDWLYVADHARALRLVLERGVVGQTYNIGGNAEARNLDVVHGICDELDALRPVPGKSRRELVTYVEDRPGHDRRYAMDARKIERELGWKPHETFASGLRRTVQWYVDNEAWWRPLLSERYAGERLGADDAR